MKTIKISDTDENADWIKWRTDDVEVGKKAKKEKDAHTTDREARQRRRYYNRSA